MVEAFSLGSKYLSEFTLKTTGAALIFVFEASLIDYLTTSLKLNDYVFNTAIICCIAIHIVIDIVFKKQISLVIKNYFSYYNYVFAVLFVILSLTGVVYLFYKY